ncbi:3-methyl-2-oxobutanoate dehydrogenase subunit VorB [Oscillospiraceae bacterium NSJ-64]|uniref:3-methyl-2-oxobutanoate dehydrogenase subunit VorB n=2 Tax=Youxingia wuxianensis TaxID=2763678 RepID=A0A926EPN6_9FIRM|nr:3-methyl-2-oxobutanoate dehydrogenase subunit VorB [Youxingia wuxianensis]
MSSNQRVLMKGNEALAEAAIQAGCHHFFGYPITPQTEVAAYMAKRLPKIGGTYLQAESEVAAINMVLGAASAGIRAMTSSSSPGISLKAEGISYIAGSDLPCLIINVQRGGPGLGGIQPSQSDYWQATRAPGHGDLHALVFAPSSIQEMVDMVFDAFDLADQYRMPSMILADGMLGQMMEPVVFPEKSVNPVDKSSWALTGHQGKRAHHIVNSLYLQPDELEKNVKERFERYELIKSKEARAEEYLVEDAQLVVVAYGATSRIVRSAINTARGKGIKVGMIRPLTLWPYPSSVIAKAAETAQAFLTVEMSMGQMVDDVRLAVNGKKPVAFFGHTGGVIPTPAEVLAEIEKMTGGDR